MKHSYLILIAYCALWIPQQLSGQESFTLSQAIDYALTHHNKIKVAELENDNAQWSYREAKAIGMPKVTSNVNYSYFYARPVNPVPDFITPSVYGVLFNENVIPLRDLGPPDIFRLGFIRSHQFNAGVNVEGILFDGNYLKGLKAARLYIDLAKKQIQLTEQELVHGVTRAYQSVLIAERNMQIIENNINNLTTILTETELIYANGFAEELDVDRLNVSLENLTLEREKINQLIDISKAALKFQMAYPIQQAIEVVEDFEMVVEKLILQPSLYSNTLDPTNRPEHRLLVDAIALDEADLIRIKQGYVPRITGNLNYDQALQRDNLFDSNEAGFIGNGSIGFKARIPIYDGGDTKSKIEKKKIELDKRQIELEEFNRAMELQVTSAIISFNNAQLTLQSAKRSLGLSEKIYDKTKIKYKEGVGSSLEVAQAETTLYNAQAQYVNALYDLLTTKTDLDIATGEILKLAKQN